MDGELSFSLSLTGSTWRHRSTGQVLLYPTGLYNSPSCRSETAATLRVTLLRPISSKSEIFFATLALPPQPTFTCVAKSLFASATVAFNHLRLFWLDLESKLYPANGLSRFHHFVQRHLGSAIIQIISDNMAANAKKQWQ